MADRRGCPRGTLRLDGSDLDLDHLFRIPQELHYSSRNISRCLVSINEDRPVRGERALPHDHLTPMLKSQTLGSTTRNFEAHCTSSDSENRPSKARGQGLP